MIEISKETNGNELKIKVAGRLETLTAPQLEEELKGILTPSSNLIFDFEGLTYLSSSGLRVLAAAQKTVYDNGSLKVINCNDLIYEIFDDVGFTDIMDIEKA